MRKTTFSNHKRTNSRTKYWTTLYANMEMTEYMHDKILVLCGIISENTKAITLRILYHLKLAPTHLLMSESGKADLLPSIPLTGTVTDSSWVTTSSTTNFRARGRRLAKTVGLSFFLPWVSILNFRRPNLITGLSR